MKLIEEIDTSTKKDIIVEGLMRSKGVYLLVSKPKVGKSMLALQLSYCLTNGLPFLGHKVTLSPVLYISTESDFGQLQDRYKTLELTPKTNSLFIIDRDGKPTISIFDHEYEIDLKRNENQTFKISNPIEDDELDENLIFFIKYASYKKDFEFTSTSIIHDAKLKTTALRFGRMLNSNIDLLEKEGLHITKSRTSSERKYHCVYEEPILEDDE